MLTNAQATQREPELPAPLPPPATRADAEPPAVMLEAPRPEAPPAEPAYAERQAEQPEEEMAAAEPEERPAADAHAAAADAKPGHAEVTGTVVDGRTVPQRQEHAAAAETGEKRAAAAADTAKRTVASAATAAAAGETVVAQAKRRARARETKRDARTGSPEPGRQEAREARPEASNLTPKAAPDAPRQPQAVDRTNGKTAATAPAVTGSRNHSPIVQQQAKHPAAELRPTAVGPAAAPVATEQAPLTQQVAQQQAMSRLLQGTTAAPADARMAARPRTEAPVRSAPQAAAALLAAAPQSTRHLQRGQAAASAAERAPRKHAGAVPAPRVEVIDRRPATALPAAATPPAPAAPAIPVPLPLFTAHLAMQVTQAQAARTAAKAAGAVEAANGPKAVTKSADSVLPQAVEPGRGETAPAARPQPVIAASRAELTRVISEVVRDARVTLSEGRTEVQLQLKPETLGRLQLKLEFAGDTLSAKVVTETLAAKQAVEQQLDGLLRQLAEQGLQVTAFSVEVGQQSRPQAHDMPTDGGSGRPQAGGATDDPAAEEQVTPRLRRRYDGQVEYLV